MKEIKEKYKKMFSVVQTVVNRWDPYGLLEGGAPADEFENEIASVVSKIKTIKTESDATKVLSQVFSEAFEPHLFTDEACVQVGRELYHELKKASFIFD